MSIEILRAIVDCIAVVMAGFYLIKVANSDNRNERFAYVSAAWWALAWAIKG